MKKLTVIVATLIMAVYAQAGSIDWFVSGLGTIDDKDGVNIGAGVTVYLVLAGSQASIISSITTGNFTYDPAPESTSGVLGTAVTSASSNIAQTFAQKDMLTATVSYNYSVLVFSTPNAYNSTVGSTGFYRFSTPMSSIANADGGHDQVVSFGSLNFPAASYTAYTVVPEPTSMALLALGVAAIGLRRKMRK